MISINTPINLFSFDFDPALCLQSIKLVNIHVLLVTLYWEEYNTN